jgi:hypothetical protein
MPITPPLNTIPIQQFINQVKVADSSKQREVRLDIETAKQLALVLGIVMGRLASDLEEIVNKIIAEQKLESEMLTVKLDGGSNWNEPGY